MDGAAAGHAPGFLKGVPLCAERNGLAAGVGVVESDRDAHQRLAAGRAVVDHQFDGREAGVTGGRVLAVSDADQRRAISALEREGAGLARLQALDDLGGVGLADRRFGAVMATVTGARVMACLEHG